MGGAGAQEQKLHWENELMAEGNKGTETKRTKEDDQKTEAGKDNGWRDLKHLYKLFIKIKL